MRVGHPRHKLLDGATRGCFDARAAATVILLKQALHLNEKQTWKASVRIFTVTCRVLAVSFGYITATSPQSS